jgi:hypothetical protein
MKALAKNLNIPEFKLQERDLTIHLPVCKAFGSKISQDF